MPAHQYYLPGRRLVSQDDASIIKRADVPRSKFTNRWNRLTTFDAGILYPFLVDEILPGDHMRYNVTAYIRASTFLFPQFSNQRFDTHFFFIPYRILWTNWVKFMGEQVNPTDTINYTIPRVTITQGAGFDPGTIWDHMGLPIEGQLAAGQSINVNVLPLRAYNKVWNTWFRDQNLQTSAPDNMGDGPDSAGDHGLQRRAKSHDYFTSALPWPQKFTPLQTLFTGTAPVKGIGFLQGQTSPALGTNFIESDSAVVNYARGRTNIEPTAVVAVRATGSGVDDPPQVYADLAQATGVTINALRQAWLVQDLLERDARGGTRYVEIIKSHFGVTSPDFRLARPEYIGGGQTPINLTPIAQTTLGGGGLGSLGATGQAAGQHSASYAATEHGIILGLMSVKTELAYQQGLHRQWTRSVRYDFYFPALAGLGEQAILRQEIYCTGVDADDAIVFGYQERFHEYRTRYSEVTGMFRSTSASNIDEWHLAQQFSPAPGLNSAFISDTPPMTRVFAAGAAVDRMHYLADILIDRVATRPIPMFGTPATLLRF